MADDTTDDSTNDTTDNTSSQDLQNTINGANNTAQAYGGLASQNMNIANGNENAAIATLQGIANSIASTLPPNLVQLAPALAQLQYTGQYSVDDVQNAVQQASALAGVKLDPQTLAAQKQDLAQYQQVAEQGFTPIERNQIAQTMNNIDTQNSGNNAAIVQQLQQQGQGGTIDQLAARLINQQQGAEQANLAGSNIAAAGQQRAISALGSAASLGQNITGEESQLATQQASAQDLVNQTNANLLQQARLSNQSANNQAAAQQQQLNTGIQEQNAQNQLASQQQQVNAANQTYNNQLQNEGLQETNAQAQGSIETGYGLPAQAAALKQSQTAASNGAAANTASQSQNYANDINTADNAYNDFSDFEGDADGGEAPTGNEWHPASHPKGPAIDPNGPVNGPGGPRDDVIPAMLSNGEFVINAKSTDKYRPVLHAINNGAEPEEIGSLLDRLCPRSTPPKKSALDTFAEGI